MPTDAQQVAEIAARLTKAQKEVLLAIAEWDWAAHGFWTERLIASGGSVAQSFCMKGLMERSFFLRSGKRHARYRLIRLGIALKAHLAASDDGRGG